jgi:23S rRNA (cytidine1920-2'-O)/16S rRNA (cytidine1409-2'-O)-methyltransferase
VGDCTHELKAKTRLDVAVVEKGLAPSRERARALILAGQVRVNGQVVSKAGANVSDEAEVSLIEPDHPYVGRGGVKLAHALDAFAIAVDGRLVLDVGASTGGFTDVLLRRGARQVVALDVGHGQLDWKLRNDPRVIVIERVNARTLTPDQLPQETRAFDVVTMDLSFISLRQVLPAIVPLLAPGADLVALVKPQFEAGRDEVGKGGLVRDPAVHARVVDAVTRAADALGLTRVAATDSPIAGAEGNREFFLHFRRTSDLPPSPPDGFGAAGEHRTSDLGPRIAKFGPRTSDLGPRTSD